MTFLISSLTGYVKSPTVPWKHQRTNPPLENIVKKSNISFQWSRPLAPPPFLRSDFFDQKNDVVHPARIDLVSYQEKSNEHFDQTYRRLSRNHMFIKSKFEIYLPSSLFETFEFFKWKII